MNKTDYSDSILLKNIKNDEEWAFKEIFNRYNLPLYNHVISKLGDDASSRDIVQDIFMALWEKRNDIQDSNLAGYLFTAARNKVLNVIKHKNIISKYESDFKKFIESYSTNTTEALLYKRDMEIIIEAEIAAFTPRMRQVFELSRKRHMTHQEIAEMLGISKHTVNAYIKTSLRLLRAKVEILLLIILLSIK